MCLNLKITTYIAVHLFFLIILLVAACQWSSQRRGILYSMHAFASLARHCEVWYLNKVNGFCGFHGNELGLNTIDHELMFLLLSVIINWSFHLFTATSGIKMTQRLTVIFHSSYFSYTNVVTRTQISNEKKDVRHPTLGTPN